MDSSLSSRLRSDLLAVLAAAALDGADDLIGFLGSDGVVVYANEAACEELQLSPDEAFAATIFDFLPSLTPELWAARWNAFRSGGRLRFVDRLRRRDGTLFPVDVRASLVTHDGLEYALVVARDITERRRTEQALGESVEAFRALAENNPSCVGRFGRDRRLVYVNPAGAAFGGRLSEDVIGRSVLELFPGDPGSRLIDESVERVFRSGEPFHMSVRLNGRDLDLQVSPERSEWGDVVSVLGIAADVTDQKALERDLRESRDFIEQVVSNAQEGIVVVDRELRYLLRNRFMEELTGIPTAGMIGVSVIDRSVPDLDELIRHVEAALRGETVRSRDSQLLVRPGMPEKWVQATFSPLRDAAGAIAGVIMVIHDMTARRSAEREARELEARMLEAQKLESLGVLAGGIAHDFSNLLVGILGNASLALASVGQDEAVRERLVDIDLAARRAADLTRQMLGYAGRGRAVVRPLDVSELVRETVDLVRAAIPRSVELRLELAEDLPPVTADRVQFQQVAMNLVINAGEAVSAAGGSVLLTTRSVELSAEEAAEVVAAGGEVASGTYVVLEVADTGAGMDPETAARVFEPFYSTKGVGRGLGLSSVLGIVRGHRGALRVESEPGRGTTFRVLLPVTASAAQLTTAAVAPRATAAADPAPAAGVPLATESVAVLLVEDEEAVARTVRRLLEACGYSVTVATGGYEALAVMRARPGVVRAVVLDLAMPGLSGGDTYRELRALDPALPVLVTSGFADGGDSVPLAGDARVAFLAKPYTAADLADALARLLAP